MTRRFVADFGRIEIRFSSCASQSIVLKKRSPLRYSPIALIRREIGIADHHQAFALVPDLRLAATPAKAGPSVSVFGSYLIFFSFRFGVVKLLRRSLQQLDRFADPFSLCRRSKPCAPVGKTSCCR